jgi:hypothetical protein
MTTLYATIKFLGLTKDSFGSIKEAGGRKRVREEVSGRGSENSG